MLWLFALVGPLAAACAAFGEADSPPSSPPGLDASSPETGDEGTVRYCATVDASYCEDFDGTEEPRDPQTTNGAALRRDDAVSLSPPYSLLATASENRAYARSRSVVDARTRMRLSFDVYLEQRGASGLAELAGLEIELSGGRLYELNVEVDSSGALGTQQFDTGLSPNRETHPLEVELPNRVWVRVEMELALDRRVVSVSIDGRAPTVLPMRDGAPDAGTLRAGYGIIWLRELAAPTSWRVRYDNVTLDRD
jgi:hypothetical protein